MLLHTSPTAIYAKSERDLSHIELARSDNISSLNGWGSPKRRMSFGGSQHSENISNSSFVNIFHESEYIDRKKNKSKNRRIFSFYSCSFCLYKVLVLANFAFVRTNAMLALSRVLKFSAKNLTHFRLICFYSVMPEYGSPGY